MSEHQAVESHGTPRIESEPVAFPCQGPACNERVLTYLTDEDVEAGECVKTLYDDETANTYQLEEND